MRRVPVDERPGWRQRQEALGFTFHSVGGRYWVEDWAYELSSAEVDVCSRTPAMRSGSSASRRWST